MRTGHKARTFRRITAPNVNGKGGYGGGEIMEKFDWAKHYGFTTTSPSRADDSTARIETSTTASDPKLMLN